MVNRKQTLSNCTSAIATEATDRFLRQRENAKGSLAKQAGKMRNDCPWHGGLCQQWWLEGYDSNSNRKLSGFEPIPHHESRQPCRHPEHFPPTHLYIPPGMQYRHVCPNCGKTHILRSPLVSLLLDRVTNAPRSITHDNI